MEILMDRGKRRLLAFSLLGLGLAFLLRAALLALCSQLFVALVMMGIALPLCRALEKRFSPGASAALSLLALACGLILLLVLLIPPLVSQFQQLSGSLPALLAWLSTRLEEAQRFLDEKHLAVTPLRDSLLEPLTRGTGALLSAVVGGVRAAASSVSKLLLSPLMAFYLLRDRRAIASYLTLLFPVRLRSRAVRAMREMRRETAGFLRGQLTVSLAVGVMSSMGLLLVGSPGWLLFGLLMGVMELIPYFGPLLAGIPAVALALQHGLSPALWTTAVLFIVQQLEGTLLSPRLMSSATRLHPLAVLLIISSGGMVGGAWGMVLSLPLVVALRGVILGARA